MVQPWNGSATTCASGNRTGRLLCLAAIVSLAVGCVIGEQRAFGKEPPAKVAKKTHGRLPAYYAAVVSEEQREEIYKIQADYKPKMTAIEAQLKAMKSELNAKISAVLTADQKKQVEEARHKAKAKKAKPVGAGAKHVPPENPPSPAR